MRPLFEVMLAAQVVGVLVSAFSLVFRSKGRSGRPVLALGAFPMLIIAATSINIADKHPGDPGAEWLMFGAAFLLGMAVALILVVVRERRGLAGIGANA